MNAAPLDPEELIQHMSLVELERLMTAHAEVRSFVAEGDPPTLRNPEIAFRPTEPSVRGITLAEVYDAAINDYDEYP